MQTGTMRLRELTVRYSVKKTDEGQPVVVGRVMNTPRESASALMTALQDQPGEVFAILCLSTKHRVIAFHEAPSAEPGESQEPIQFEPLAEEGRETPAVDYCDVSPKTILEAMLFVGRPDNQPLVSEEVAALRFRIAPRGASEPNSDTIPPTGETGSEAGRM